MCGEGLVKGYSRKKPREIAGKGRNRQTLPAHFRALGWNPMNVGEPGFPSHPLVRWCKAGEGDKDNGEKDVRTTGSRIEAKDLFVKTLGLLFLDFVTEL